MPECVVRKAELIRLEITSTPEFHLFCLTALEDQSPEDRRLIYLEMLSKSCFGCANSHAMKSFNIKLTFLLGRFRSWAISFGIRKAQRCICTKRKGDGGASRQRYEPDRSIKLCVQSPKIRARLKWPSPSCHLLTTDGFIPRLEFWLINRQGLFSERMPSS